MIAASWKKVSPVLEFGLWALTIGAVMLFVAERQSRAGVAHEAIDTFRDEVAAGRAGLTAPLPDQDAWSPGRVAAYDPDAAGAHAEALLHIPKLNLIAPIRDGTDEHTLNSFVGRVQSAAGLGEEGNLVLAAHRDGYFRRLGNLQPNDVITLETHTTTRRYAVTETLIVKPEDVSVMHATSKASVTLITCYPFFFVGPAPRRYVVRGELLGDDT